MASPFKFGDPATAAERAAARLLELIVERDLTFEQLGDRMHPPVDKSVIRRLTLGPRHKDGIKISLQWMYRLAIGLECHPTDLMPDLPPTTLPRAEREHVDHYMQLGEPDRAIVDSVIEGRRAAAGLSGDAKAHRRVRSTRQ